MDYIVTFIDYGDEQIESFENKEEALEYIERNINSEDKQNFCLYTKIPLTFSVNVD